MARKRSGTGLVTVRQIRGLGDLKNPKSFLGAALPPLLGGGVTGIALLATRHFAKPAESETQRMLYRWAPLVGIGVGGLSSAALYWVGGAPAMISSAIASVTVGVSALVFDYLLKDRLGDQALAMAEAATPSPEAGATSGFGVVVPQRIAGVGTQGILMEPAASRDPVNRYGLSGQYGEDVRLGSVNPSAFGTPGFGSR